ncbi:TIM barrel protein [Kineococcus xinjiangensis]|uniref:TIM barrel protein n=1 Tax=Kineococcus xinjiangensis TaxID=512762 RepID=UPI003182FE35
MAGAPISWGVCEVPGWGYQLPAATVLSQMAALGLRATEFGPDGFLPADPLRRADVLAGHGLAAVGGFVPVVLHRADADPLPALEGVLDGFVASGADVLVVAAATGLDGYDTRPELGEDEWDLLLRRLDRITERAAERGLTAVLHPHVGTLVESGEDVERVLDGGSAALCLDTGHLLIGGADPLAIARRAPERIAHVHLKDVDASWIARVRAGELTYSEAVAAGMYRPLGAGDADVAGIVAALEGAGYGGWYVLEQDTVLAAPAGEEDPSAPVVADVRASIEHLLGPA